MSTMTRDEAEAVRLLEEAKKLLNVASRELDDNKESIVFFPIRRFLAKLEARHAGT